MGTMEFKSIVRKACNELRNDIAFGDFKPGDRVSEKLLTQKYGVSRTSIREICRQLASEGYLTLKPYAGVVVTKLSLRDVDIIYNILSRCESYATALFTQRQDRICCEKLGLLNKKMQSPEAKLEYKIWLEINDKFHRSIFSNCGSPILSDLIYHTRLRIYRFRRVSTIPEYIDQYNRQHSKILKAICDRNSSLAEKLMMDHLEFSRARRLELFREFDKIF